MKRFVLTVALVCAVSSSTLAGEVPTGGIAPPPPPQAQTSSTTSPGEVMPGEVPTGGFAQQISDAALSALLTALGLLTV
jgi:hypothetical protein